MRILVDTNLLVRLVERADPLHDAANLSIAKLRNERHELCLVHQVLYEYWVVVTRPLAQNGLGMFVADADKAIESWLGVFTLLRDERGVFSTWRDLVRNHEVIGKQAHDARLIAAMQRHGVECILTFNGQDFKRYPNIQVLDPMSMTEPSA